MTKKGAASVLLFVHEENDKEVYNDTTKGRFHRNSARYGSSEPGDLAERAEKGSLCFGLSGDRWIVVLQNTRGHF